MFCRWVFRADTVFVVCVDVIISVEMDIFSKNSQIDIQVVSISRGGRPVGNDFAELLDSLRATPFKVNDILSGVTFIVLCDCREISVKVDSKRLLKVDCVPFLKS